MVQCGFSVTLSHLRRTRTDAKYDLKWQCNYFQRPFLCKSDILSYCRFLKEHTGPSTCRKINLFVLVFSNFYRYYREATVGSFLFLSPWNIIYKWRGKSEEAQLENWPGRSTESDWTCCIVGESSLHSRKPSTSCLWVKNGPGCLPPLEKRGQDSQRSLREEKPEEPVPSSMPNTPDEEESTG